MNGERSESTVTPLGDCFAAILMLLLSFVIVWLARKGPPGITAQISQWHSALTES
jgi:hypothetical protein